ncbi:MAG: hypothetical protein WKF50_13150 [Nocardioides sp.]
MQPIHIPEEWDSHDLLTFEQFCDLIQIPVRTVRDWRRRDTGPRWHKLEGGGRLYITVAETRRFVRTAADSVGRGSLDPRTAARDLERPGRVSDSAARNDQALLSSGSEPRGHHER